MFRTGFSIHHQESSTVHSGIRMDPDATSKQSAKPVRHIPIAVCTVLDFWWWTENLSETCRVLFQR